MKTNHVNLYPYQTEAIQRMNNGCILCGGVGSGKSRTSLAYYAYINGGKLDASGISYYYSKHCPSLYIITTARKRDTLEWEGEFIPFQIGDMVGNHTINSVPAVVDSWNNINKYKDVKNAFFIFDEQRVVGYGAWTKAFLQIAKNNQWILLSATPGDNWSDYIPVFIANGFFRNKTEFTQEHCVYDRFSKFPKINRYINTGRLIRLRNKILVDMDFKRETIPNHIDVWCEYDQLMYKTINKDRWNFEKNEPITTASELCYALRKVVNSHYSRIEQTLDILKGKEKAIIFYNFNYELDMLREALDNAGYIYGEWNGQKHEDVPHGDKWAYLVQYTAGAEGWNCIRTNTVIFFSQNYSYKITAQSSGRIDRLNTPYTDLYFYHLKSHANIDMAIARALREKKKFNEGKFVNG